MRIRSIHPGIFTDEAFASVGRDARLLFIGLWCEADDNGVFEWKPLSLKMKLFPGDGDVNMSAWLDALVDHDMIRCFEDNGRAYGAIRNFGRYQRPRSPKYVHPCPEAIARYAAKDGIGEPGPLAFNRDLTAAERKRQQRERERETAINESKQEPAGGDIEAACHSSDVTPATNVTPFPSPLQQSAEQSRQMKEVCISDTTYPHTKPAPKRDRNSYPADFDAFWQAYPRDNIMSKKEAFGAWRRLGPDDRQMATAALPAFKAHCARNPTYRPVHACRFLSQRRFETLLDSPPPNNRPDNRGSIFNRG